MVNFSHVYARNHIQSIHKSVAFAELLYFSSLLARLVESLHVCLLFFTQLYFFSSFLCQSRDGPLFLLSNDDLFILWFITMLVLWQGNTKLADERLELVQYDPSPAGMVQSWIER